MLLFIFLINLLTISCLKIWFESNLRTRLLKFLKIIPVDLYLSEEVSKYLAVNRGAIGELLDCPLCFGTWVAAFWSIFLVLGFAFPSWYILVGIFSPHLLISWLI